MDKSLESFERKEKSTFGVQGKGFNWRNKTLTDTSSSPLRQLSGRLFRLLLSSKVTGGHVVGSTLGFWRELYGTLRRPGQGVALHDWTVVVNRWLVLRHHLGSAWGSVQRVRHLVRLVVIELAQVGIQRCLLLHMLGEIRARARWVLGGLLLGRQMVGLELRADDFDALDDLLNVVWALVGDLVLETTWVVIVVTLST